MSSHHHPPPEFNPLNDISRVLNSHPPSPIQSLLAESFQLILTALRDFGPKNVALSFNGGKDCTILLHLLYAAHQAYIRDTATSNDTSKEDIRIPTLYVACHDPFPQVESFVTECVDRYHLNLTRLSTPLKPALAHFLASTNPIPTAILLGTRSTDPHSSHLKPLHPTDPSWPAITRVHPILQWSYADVWTGINLLGIPTCELYRAGYTSLGGRGDTCPNPALLKPDSTYHPAEWLLDGCRERDGRGVKPPAPAIISSDSGLVVANAEMERVLDSAAP
ncbi:FAD synthetase [Phlyctochytrium arcticum]|nr:FAD synthetase [Phlyctochytrium arcticum]